jgi:cation:H+ antiporter
LISRKRIPAIKNTRSNAAPDLSNSNNAGVFFLLFALAAVPIRNYGPAAILWTGPGILLASTLVAWGAESAQFFIAQGFALAILAWMQTLPEFAVEAVLAWKQQTPLLLANLSGALRLLTGLGWPAIYFAAAFVQRKRTGEPLRAIRLDSTHSVQVLGLLPALLYALVIWAKGTLHLYDSGVLIAIYAAFLLLLSKLPPEEEEGIEELELIPRTIVMSPRVVRVALIGLCFAAGGALIYFTAEPFLGSLIALSGFLGIPAFLFIQWIAPIASEFPEMASTFYFARTVTGAPMALMNMVSSNINQWTLLVAMLPMVFSLSLGAPTAIPFDNGQEIELLLTVAQALVAMLLLANMEFSWWEAAGLFTLYVVQFVLSTLHPASPAWLVNLAANNREYTTAVYFAWGGLQGIRMLARREMPPVARAFAETWRSHVAG